MKSAISNKRIADELVKRGLVPDGCRLLELSIGVSGAAFIRYERLIYGDELAKIAEALKSVAGDVTADDERNRIALKSDGRL